LATHATFTRDGGRSSGSPRIRDMRTLESPRVTNQSRSRIRQPRRPATGDSASSAKPSSPFTNDPAPWAFHQPSHSASAVEARTESKDDIIIVENVTTPQPSLFSGHSPPQHPSIHPSLERARTPDPPVNDSTSAGHVALSRHSNAPAFESFADTLTAHVKHDPETRYISSANKHTKMGFSAKESLHPTVPNSVSPRGHEQKPRFGLKSFFKGKT